MKVELVIGALIPHDRCPYKKRQSGPICTEGCPAEDTGMRPIHAPTSGLGGPSPARLHPGLELPAARTGQNGFPLSELRGL